MTATPVQAPISAPHQILCVLEEDLRDLHLQVNKTFLNLGNTLQSISARSRAMATLATSVVELASAGASTRIVEMLNVVLVDTERIRDLTETSSRQMQLVFDGLHRSRSALAVLAQLPDVLNAVRILWKIEGEKLQREAMDVSGLAADIGTLKKEVDYNVRAMDNEAERLVRLVAGGSRRLSAIEEHEREEAGNLIHHARAVLNALQERAVSSDHAARLVEAQYAGIRDAIDKIVMLLQSEDIARQRMEHIEQAMRQAVAAAERGEPQDHYVPIIILQRAQLLDARDFLVNSIQSIKESVTSLPAMVGSLTRETDDLASEHSQTGHALKSDIERGLAAVSSVLGRFSASARAIVSTVDNVVPALKGMARSADKLSQIENAIRIIAINAAIKTGQLGGRGTIIGALAERLQDATTESEEHTHAVVQALKGIEQSLQLISEHGIDKENRVLNPDAMRAVHMDVHSILADVLEASQKLATQLASLLELAQKLREEIEVARSVSEEASSTEDRFDFVIKSLDKSLEQLGAASLPELHDRTREKLTALAATYSMESQRKVHRSLIETIPSEKVAARPDNQNSDLGDNVELF